MPARSRPPEGGPIIPPQTDDQGYLYVMLAKHGVETQVYVHEIVAEAAHGPCPPGMKAAHKNGIKTDNRPSNLRYVPVGP